MVKYIYIFFFFSLIRCSKHNFVFKTKYDVDNIISIDREKIIYKSSQNYIIVEDLKNHRVIWKHKMQVKLSLCFLKTNFFIFYTTPNGVVCLDKLNGNVKYIIKIYESVRTYSLLNIGNEVFAVSQFGIYSFNKHNGKIIWKKRVSESKLISNSKALFKKDIFITANSLFNDKDDFEIVKLEKNKKRVIWRYSLGKSEASFISINKENLYLIINQSNTERKLICVDVNDGRKKWEIIGNIKHGSEIICFGDFIYCSSDKGILKIDSKTGLIQEEISLKINFYKFYDVTNDYLLLRKQSNLFFLNLKERKITKTFDLKYYNLHKNGKLLFYSQKNSVFKIVNIFDSDLNALE